MIRLVILLILLVGVAALIETGRARDAATESAGIDRPADRAPGDPLSWESRAKAATTPEDGGLHGNTLAAVTQSVLARAEAEAMAALAAEGAPMLAAWISRSRAAVIAMGAAPIPPDIHGSLAKYYPEALLKRVRYRVGWGDPGSLPGRLFAAYGQAMTLDDVIVFRTEAVARDPVIWAHEIAHVEQYRRWGVDGFARRYVEDHRSVEREAWQTTGAWAERQGDPTKASR